LNQSDIGVVDLFDATKVAKAFLRVDTCREGKTSSPLLKAQVLGAYKLKTTIEEQKIEHRFFGYEEVHLSPLTPRASPFALSLLSFCNSLSFRAHLIAVSAFEPGLCTGLTCNSLPLLCSPSL